MNPETQTPAAKRPRVWFLNFWPQGGMRHYSEGLVRLLAESCDLVYACNYAAELPCRVERFDVTLNPLRPRNWAEMARLLQMLRADPEAVIHLNSDFPLLLSLYPLLEQRRSVLTLHDAVPHNGESLAKRIFHTFHLRVLPRYVRTVVVHSEKIRDQLPASIPRGQVATMPLGSQLEQQPLEAGPSAGAKNGEVFRFLFFGRILAYKGLDVLLEAFRSLPPDRFHLTIAGEGKLPHGIPAEVEIHNRFIADGEIPAFFANCDAVVLPYRAASQSGVIPMAFHFGKPVVATSVGAIPEAVEEEENALLVPPDDVPALAAALRRISEPAVCARLAAGASAVRGRTNEIIRARLLEIYESR